MTEAPKDKTVTERLSDDQLDAVRGAGWAGWAGFKQGYERGIERAKHGYLREPPTWLVFGDGVRGGLSGLFSK